MRFCLLPSNFGGRAKSVVMDSNYCKSFMGFFILSKYPNNILIIDVAFGLDIYCYACIFENVYYNKFKSFEY
jgi:hypothetical protein